MLTRRRALALSPALFLLTTITSTSFAQQVPPPAQPPRYSDTEKREIPAIAKTIEAIEAGQPAPNDFGLTWLRDDVIRVQGNKQYIPFVVSVDPKVEARNVLIYWRATPVSAAPAAPAPTDGRGADRNAKPVQTPYLFSINTASSLNSSEGRIARSFVLDPGAYDIHVVVKEPTSTQRNAPPPKQSVLKHRLEVPNLWTGEFTTSSLLVGRIDPLPAPLTPQQQVERPYALGGMEIVPSTDLKFTKKSEMSMLMVIYNAKTDPASLPDLQVEYNFHAKQPDGSEKFFNKTDPQNMNAQTLPPQAAGGTEIQAGQSIPLASFPEGDYRLEIKVTDKIGNQTLTRTVNFTVAGA